MIIGTGIDIVEIARLRKAVEKTPGFLEHFLTPEELDFVRSRKAAFLECAAGRWAAKEAVAKALGCGFGSKCSWLDITIRNAPSGLPEVYLTGSARQTAESSGIIKIHLSISHEQNYAIAQAIAEK